MTDTYYQTTNFMPNSDNYVFNETRAANSSTLFEIHFSYFEQIVYHTNYIDLKTVLPKIGGALSLFSLFMHLILGL